jgi:hypothetical protein
MGVKVIGEALGRGERPPGVPVGRAVLSEVGILRAEVRLPGRPEGGPFVPVRGSGGAIGALAVVPEVVLVARVVRVSQVLGATVVVVTAIVQGVVEAEDGLVLVVVDHHPADDAARLGPRSALHLRGEGGTTLAGGCGVGLVEARGRRG